MKQLPKLGPMLDRVRAAGRRRGMGSEQSAEEQLAYARVIADAYGGDDE